MMSYINETDFVIENKKLVYPEIVADGLQLYYDSKGKRDTDYHRDTLLDMSGNKNHGKLHNFAYEKHSGYKDGLVFDYIDDKLVRPKLNLKPDDFTFMLNGNIISFSPDGTVKRVQDGEVIENKGFNLIKNGDFILSNHPEWRQTNSLEYNINKNEITIIGKGHPMGTGGNWFALNTISSPKSNSIFYITALAKGQGQAYIGVSYNATNLYLNDSFRRVAYLGEFTTNNSVNGLAVLGGTLGATVTFKEVMAINLTQTFGAGNEPTKEQMDEIINRFGFIPNAQDLIDRIEYKGNDLGDMENIIDGLYKTEVLSGEEIYTDEADDAVVHVDVDGKSYQHAKDDSKNLAPNAEHWEYSSGASYDSKTGEITIPVKGKVNFLARWDGKTTSARLSMDTVSGGGFLWNTTYYAEDKSTRVHEDSNTWTGNGMVPSWSSNPVRISTTTPTLNSNTKWIGMQLTGASSYTPSTAKIKNVALKSGSDSSYEPPAPTPDYPIEIHSLNDFDVVSSVGGRNLILNSKLVPNSSNNTGLGRVSLMKDESTPYYRVIGDKIISTYGFDGSATSSRFSEPMINSDTYTVSVDVRAPRTGRVSFFDGMGSQSILKANEWIRIKHTYTYKGMSYRVIGLTYNSSIIDYRNWKIEKGTTPTPWTPAPEDIIEESNHPLIDKINLSLSEPLRSVGEVKDRLFRDNDGLWKIERNVGEAQIGDSNIANISIGASNNVVTTSNIDNIKYYTSYGAPFRSTHHGKMKGNPGSTWGNVESRGTATINTFGNMWLSVDKENIDTVEKAKNWFEGQKTAGTPVTVQYALETSTIETLDQELQDKLNNLRSFEDSNYVYTVLSDENNKVSNNLKPTLHAKFLYNNWYKEDRVINNLMMYNRALTNEEMLQNYKTIKRRWGM